MWYIVTDYCDADPDQALFADDGYMMKLHIQIKGGGGGNTVKFVLKKDKILELQ